jgi:integrase/recombinase XerD
MTEPNERTAIVPRSSRPSLEAQAVLQAARECGPYDTVAAYSRDAAQYVEFCAGKGLALAEGLTAWVSSQLEAGLLPTSINRKLSAVKSCIRRATNMQDFAMQAQIEAALRLAKPVKQTKTGGIRPEKMLTPGEVGRLLVRMSPRGQGFVRFLFATGCRVSEMLKIRLVDCTEDGGRVAIAVTGKGDAHRTVRITKRLFDELRGVYDGKRFLFETGNGTAYRREYVSHMIERVSIRVLRRRLSAHALRHAAATELLERTGKLQAVSEYLGHADPSTTLRFYAHQALSDLELVALESSFGPSFSIIHTR